MTPFFTSDRGSIYKARAEDVYPLIEPGSVSLVISDGPYGMSKADWDRMKPRDLPEWYGPHIEAWGEVCAPSATVYVWGTDEGEGYLRAPMREAGWTFRGAITWDKGNPAGLIFAAQHAGWGDATERCGVWQRGKPFDNARGTNVWRMGHGSWTHERLSTGKIGVSIGGDTEWKEPVHPCQKPIAWSERMLLASCPVDGLTLEPFGGTCRAAVACERLPRDEARRYVCVEPDEDGRDYLPAILPQLRYDPADDEVGLQPGLFQ